MEESASAGTLLCCDAAPDTVLAKFVVGLGVNELVAVAEAEMLCAPVVVVAAFVDSGTSVAREAGRVDCPADNTAHADSTTERLDLMINESTRLSCGGIGGIAIYANASDHRTSKVGIPSSAPT